MALTSLRGTAREIGTSPAVLDSFMEGARPYPRTLRKLLDWQVREHASRRTPPPPEIAQAAVSALLRHLPLTRQQAATRRILALVEECGAGAALPPWLAALREEGGEGE